MGNGRFLSNFNVNTRFKLYIVRSPDSSFSSERNYLESEGIRVLNLGEELSKEIQGMASREHLEIKALKIVEDLTSLHSTIAINGTRIVAITNFGILLEPDLGLNAGQILTDLSKRFVVLLLWSGMYGNDGTLFWNAESDEVFIDVRRASPQILDLNYEV